MRAIAFQSLLKQGNRLALIGGLISLFSISCGSSDPPVVELCEPGQELACSCTEEDADNRPMILGADPQGTSGQTYFFNGKIQQATVLSWGGAGHRIRKHKEST